MPAKSPIHIIYIPGFGGRYDSFRLWAIRKWKYMGVTAEFVPMNWRGGTFEQKLARIDRAIDRASGKMIVLIGESAGGSMVIHQYARRGDDLYKVMALCGKNTHPETVGQEYFDRSPAFKASMDLLNKSLDELTTAQRKRFVAIRPLYDPVIPIDAMLLPGCRRVRLPFIGHLPSIVAALTILSPLVVRAAKSK